MINTDKKSITQYLKQSTKDIVCSGKGRLSSEDSL